MREGDARHALVDAAVRLDDAGLNHNASGNLSIRVGDDVLVTPSGIPAHRVTPDDLVLVDLDGRAVHERHRVPTSEWRLHTAVMRRRLDVHAIVHTHSPEATAAASLGVPIPAVHYVVARFATTELRCAPYATFGTDELATHVVDTLGEHATACLMANHGAITVAADLRTAVALALDVEWFCGVFRRATALGDPDVLDAAEIERVAERFRSYGQPGDST